MVELEDILKALNDRLKNYELVERSVQESRAEFVVAGINLDIWLMVRRYFILPRVTAFGIIDFRARQLNFEGWFGMIHASKPEAYGCVDPCCPKL